MTEAWRRAFAGKRGSCPAPDLRGSPLARNSYSVRSIIELGRISPSRRSTNRSCPSSRPHRSPQLVFLVRIRIGGQSPRRVVRPEILPCLGAGLRCLAYPLGHRFRVAVEERHHEPRPCATQADIQLRNAPSLEKVEGPSSIIVRRQKEAPFKVARGLGTCAPNRIEVVFIPCSVRVFPIRLHAIIGSAVDAKSAVISGPTLEIEYRDIVVFFAHRGRWGASSLNHSLASSSTTPPTPPTSPPPSPDRPAPGRPPAATPSAMVIGQPCRGPIEAGLAPLVAVPRPSRALSWTPDLGPLAKV